MGKYLKKSKIKGGDIAVTELTQSSMGVRTRAKTLALQLLQNVSPPNSDSTTYLQLRSRRLEKNPNQQNINLRASSRLRPNLAKLDSVDVVPITCCEKSEGVENGEAEGFNDGDVEISFGENDLEFEARERSKRESTPCNFRRECHIIPTPGSTTRLTGLTSSNQRVRNVVQRNIPYTWEIDEFFACAEQRQQMLFANKYNFDFASEMPLPGHYDWVSVNP